ncbi:MAG TPA: FkbM family methyltransferase [Aliiroseovarius sp.]|nr:FkbM family methyltransferase [Aliiroseovarius sp.]
MTPEIERILKRLRLGRPVHSRAIELTHARIEDKRVTFCTDMEHDPIQRNHRRGQFYEAKELNGLKEVFPKGGTFVDIGANVGNHGLFAALFLGAARVIPFEPNPLAYRLLIQNVLVNRLDDVFDLSRLGVGLSDVEEGGFAMEKRTRNLGGAKMLSGKGKLQVFRGDTLLEKETPAMIKIDVEGMEMGVLGGLTKVIATHKPILLVEVDNENEEAFMAWAKSTGYDVAETVQRYRLNKNHLLVPKAATTKKTKAKTKAKPKAKTKSGTTRKTTAKSKAA